MMIPNVQFNDCNFNNIIYHIPQNNREIQKALNSIAKDTLINCKKNAQFPIQGRDEYIFNQIVRRFEEKKQNNIPYSMNSFKRSLKEFRFNPHPRIYSKWLNQSRMLKHQELATIIFKHFRTNRTAVKSERDYLCVYSIFMDICKRNEQPNLCISYFKEMENLGIKADVNCYTILINVYAKKERLDLCLAYYKKMKRLGINLNQKCYYALIYACGRNHRPKLALAFWRRMKKEGMRSGNIKTLSLVIDSLSWDYTSFKQLENQLPPLLISRVKALHKEGEVAGKFDFHNWSSKLAKLILYRYLENKKDVSPLILVSGIGKHNKSGKLFAMKTHITEFLDNYSSKEFSFTHKSTKRNLGKIDIYFTKKSVKENPSDLSSSLVRLINSLSSLKMRCA